MEHPVACDKDLLGVIFVTLYIFRAFFICCDGLFVNDFIFLQFGLRDDNKRNSLRSISESNQFIHSYGTNQQLYDDGSFSQELKKTYSKEAYFLLKTSSLMNS